MHAVAAHVVPALLCAAVAVLAYLVTVLRRRVRATSGELAAAAEREALLVARVGALRQGAAASASREEQLVARVAALEVQTATRFRALEGSALTVALRFCPRVHAADLPPGWVAAPVSPRVPNEEEVNPLIR